MPLFIQALAVIAFICFFVSFQTKSRKEILLWQIVGLLFYITHYALLEAWSGALLTTLNLLITIFFLFKDSRWWIKSRYFLLGALLTLGIATMFTWTGYYSILPLVGVSTIVLAKWQRKPNNIRSISIFNSVFWIIYDMFVGSCGGVISETGIIISIVIGLVRSRK